MIAHAVAASPYYRDLLGPDAASGGVPLAELPTLPKATLMDDFDRIVTDPRLRREEVEAHLAGPDAGRPLLGRYRAFTTTGTTGRAGCSSRRRRVRGLDRHLPARPGLLGPGAATRLAGIGSPSPLHVSNQV